MRDTADSDIDHTQRVLAVRTINDPLFDIGRGILPGKTSAHEFGTAAGITTSSEDVIWSGSTAYNFPTSAQTVRVKAGGDAADTAAGAGARTIRVIGLDQNWNEATEDITLAGASASSATTTTFIRISSVYVLTSGTYGAANTGIINIENTSSAAVLAVIEAGLGQSTKAVYTVPANKTAYLYEYDIVVEGSKPVDIKMYQRQSADDVTVPYTGKRLVTSIGALSGAYYRQLKTGISFPAKTDIWFTGKATASTAKVSVTFDFVLVDNT